jgi:hypothetical protein
MTVLVESGVACIPGTESGAQANYWATNDAQVTLSISAAHATLPRIDIVVVNIRDTFYSGASNDSQLQVITGTPASSPAVPTAPANSITICQVAVGAAVTSIVDANITDVRYYLASAGGVINSRTLAAAPVGGTEVTEGQLVWDMTTNRLYVWDGTAYVLVWPPNGEGLNAAGPSSTDNLTSDTYVNISATGTTTSFSFTKRSADTRLKIEMHATFFSSSVSGGARFGVNINSTDYDVSSYSGALPAANARVFASGVRYVASIPAGTHTVQARWRRADAVGTITRVAADWLSVSVLEVV